jgi:hypothetical protein
MKQFLKIFLTNLIPPRSFILEALTVITIAIVYLLPLYLIARYVPSHIAVYLGMTVAYLEIYIFFVAVKSWQQYKRSK